MEVIEINNMIDLVRYMRTKAQLYIGERKISSMAIFLTGYKTATWVNQTEQNVGVTKNWMDFHEFTNRKYNKPNQQSYVQLLLEQCGGDEEKALDLFFEVFEEFVAFQETLLKS